MLYKNKIKVQNILKSAVALMLMLTLSLSTALSPLAKAEEAKYTWKTLTSAPATGATGLRKMYVTQDGSKLFIQEKDSSHNSNLWMSADDGATWRKIFSKQIDLEDASLSADVSKITLTSGDGRYLYISTDGGQNWTEKAMWATASAHNSYVRVSPDGSFLVGCSPDTTITHNYAYATYISTDDGQTWTQKGTNYMGCNIYMANNGMLISRNSRNDVAKSTDYGQTWTEISNFSNNSQVVAFSNNGNNVLDGDRISLDGGNHWTPSNAPIPSNSQIVGMDISEDGKKLFIATQDLTSAEGTLLTSVDGGRTWRVEYQNLGLYAVMSSDGSKLLYSYEDISSGVQVTHYRVGTLPAAQPVTPGSGAGGAATPSASTSATPGQKPGKASGRLAETGTSTWMVGGLAVVAVAAGALVLRKRL